MDVQHTLTDSQLVTKALKDSHAFGELMERYQQRLLRYILRLSSFTQEEAEDILQEVFIKVWRNLRGYDMRFSFSTWIYRITRNHTISSFRKKKSRNEVHVLPIDETIIDVLASDMNIEQDSQNNERGKHIEEILNSLPVKYKDVLLLKYFEGYSYDEISDILKKPAGTVATLINRAKKAVKDYCTHHNITL